MLGGNLAVNEKGFGGPIEIAQTTSRKQGNSCPMHLRQILSPRNSFFSNLNIHKLKPYCRFCCFVDARRRETFDESHIVLAKFAVKVAYIRITEHAAAIIFYFFIYKCSHENWFLRFYCYCYVRSPSPFYIFQYAEKI